MADATLLPQLLRDDPSCVPVGFSTPLPDGRLRCDLCPRACAMRDGQRGLCFVRGRIGDQLVLTTYGRSSGFCVDPIEKKPLNHFLPGSAVLSFGTAGCNLSCSFCQNWDISKSRQMDTLAANASGPAIAEAAVASGCRSVAFTYNDPVIFLEYARDVAAACHARGVRTVAVTAGYVTEAARQAFFSFIDAANVDLKAFTEEFYKQRCGGQLAPVKDTLRYLVHDTEVHVEITTLLIPGLNDGAAELAALAKWCRDELRPDVPLHFSAFHPDYKLTDRPRTPVHTLRKAREIALSAGLQHVYTGNVHDVAGDTTRCVSCGEAVIVRDWYALHRYHLDDSGHCLSCGDKLAGVFDGPARDWGRKRMRVSPR